MSTEADLAPLLEALVTCVGIIDGFSLLTYIFDRSYRLLTGPRVLHKDENNNNVAVKAPTKPHKTVTTCTIPQVIVDDGFTSSDPNHDATTIDSLLQKVNDLETKVHDLEVRSRESSVERLLEVERIRRSRSPTPYSRAHHSEEEEESSSSDERYRRSKSPSPRVRLHLTRNSLADGEFAAGETSSVDDDESNNTTTTENSSASQSREDSVKRQPPPLSKPISRDDEFRKTKRSSPHAATESREEELAALTRIEREENENMADFVPIVYEGHEDDVYSAGEIIYMPPVSPIQEDVEEFSGPTASSPIDSPTPAVDVNESFIRMEQRAQVQTSMPKSTAQLVKQESHVSDEEFETTKTLNLPSTLPLPLKQTEPINSTELSQEASAIDKNEFAVITTTTEPDVSINTSMNVSEDAALDAEVSHISSSSPNALRRTRRCVESLNQALSPTRRSRKSATPASEEDYKDWFDKFDSHLSPNLTLENDEEYESEVEEEFLVDDKLSGAEICKIDDDLDENRDVSVSITLALNKKSPTSPPPTTVVCHPCAEFQQQRVFKTKAEELEELHRFRNSTGAARRFSITPSSEEAQRQYVSVFHPEEFPSKAGTVEKKPRQHHVHLHNVGYHEWMKKLVEHNSSHLALSDTDSDSDVSLDEVRMLLHFG